jgi:hypothetical protein
MSATKMILLRWWIFEDNYQASLTDYMDDEIDDIVDKINTCFSSKVMDGYKASVYYKDGEDFGYVEIPEKYVDDYLHKYFVVFTRTPFNEYKKSVYFEED